VLQTFVGSGFIQYFIYKNYLVMRKIYVVFVLLFGLLSAASAQNPYFLSGPTDGIGQYGYLEKDATTFMAPISNTYGNIYQMFGRTFLNGTNILTYGSAINSCGPTNVIQTTNNYSFGANAIAGQIAYTSVHVDYCGGGNSYSSNPNQTGLSERQHYIFDVTDRPSDLSADLLQSNAGGLSPNNVVMSLKIDFGSVSSRILNRLWIQNAGTLAEATEIANDGFKVYYENATGTEVFNGSESFGTLYGDYNSNATNNNIYGNDALGIPIPAGGLRIYIVLNKFSTCISSAKSVQVSTINDGMDFTPGMDVSFTKARMNTIPTAPSTINMLVRYVWAGTAGSDWFNSSNWCGVGVVPSAGSNVIIPTGAPNYPIILAGTALANDINIAAGASVTVNASGIFNSYGAITNGGTFDVTAGTLNMTGTSPQTLAGASLLSNSVRNLIIKNNTTLSDEVKVTTGLTFGTTGITLTTNGNLTLVSNATGTAYVGNTTGNTITGTASIERYLTAVKSWRYLATPVVIGSSPTITESWREGGAAVTSTGNGYGTRITGPGAVGNPLGLDQVTQRGSMKSYNSTNNTFTEITSNDLATGKQIANNEGYAVFVNGDRGVDALSGPGVFFATTLRVKGNIRTGNQTFTAPPATIAGNDGFESIGNPFPSQINFKTVTKSNIEPSITFWNPNAGFYGVGRYVQYVSTTGLYGDYRLGLAGPILNEVESGQAFFIQSTVGNSGSIIITESDKLSGSNNVSRPGVTIPTLEINLHQINNTTTQTLLDNVVLNFDASYSNGFDNNDVRKFMNSTDNLAIKNGTRNLILERKNILTNTDTIRLSLTNTRISSYRFEIDPSVLGNLNLAAFLKDKFLQTETSVSLTAITNVNFDITADAASKVADRFMIVFRQAAGGPLPVRFIDIAAAKNADNTNTVKWNVGNELNIQQYEIERSEKGRNFVTIGNMTTLNNTGSSNAYNFVDAAPLAQDNYYRIKAISQNAETQYSAIVRVLADTKATSISVYPNPVEGKKMHVSFTNKVGTYSLVILSSEGKAVFTQNIVITSENEVKLLYLNKHIAQGYYELVITSSEGVKNVLPIIVQ
jgi:hypothetical protein